MSEDNKNDNEDDENGNKTDHKDEKDFEDKDEKKKRTPRDLNLRTSSTKAAPSEGAVYMVRIPCPFQKPRLVLQHGLTIDCVREESNCSVLSAYSHMYFLRTRAL